MRIDCLSLIFPEVISMKKRLTVSSGVGILRQSVPLLGAVSVEQKKLKSDHSG